MQNKAKIILNPNYKGPIVIEEYLRKIKNSSSLGRMISNFNKRLFALDFRHMRFYYLPERGAQLSTATDIPLESITRIYLDSQLAMLDDTQMWKHGFVILTGKKSYRLISYARSNMESLLYAFGHLTNTETGKPLFDWNEYKVAQENDPMRGSEPIRPQIFSPPAEEKEGKPSRSGSDDINEKEGREGAVSAKKEKKTQEDPEKYRQVKASNSERQEAQESPERPVRQEREQERDEERRERKADAYKMRGEEKEKSREGSNGVSRESDTGVSQVQLKVVKNEVDSVGLCESKVVEEASQVFEQNKETRNVKYEIAESREEVRERKVGSVRARVEVLTIDSEENGVPVGRNAMSYSTRNNPYVSKDNNGLEPKLVSPKNPFGGRPLAKAKKSSEEEIGSGRVNEVEAMPAKKKSSDDDWDTTEKPRVQANKNYLQQNEQEQNNGWENSRDKKGDTGVKKIQNDDWDAKEVKPRKEEVQTVKKNAVDDDDDWDKDMESPPKKSGKTVEVKETTFKAQNNGWGSETNIRSVPSHVKNHVVKKVDDDDDWDKDMESPPKKNGKKMEVKETSWAKETSVKKETVYKAQDDGWGSETNVRSVPSHVKNSVVKKVDESDDWDQEMFSGNQSKRLDVRTEYRNGIQNSTAGLNKAKNVEYGSYKQTQVPVATRGQSHNDWDDDL